MQNRRGAVEARDTAMKYTCEYFSGDSRGHDGGIWEKTETPKTITFKCIKESYFGAKYKLLKFRKATRNLKRGDVRYHGYGSVLIDGEDGTYTVYPNQSGVPHFFEPLTIPQENAILK